MSVALVFIRSITGLNNFFWLDNGFRASKRNAAREQFNLKRFVHRQSVDDNTIVYVWKLFWPLVFLTSQNDKSPKTPGQN